jgi:hypothetical protein
MGFVQKKEMRVTEDGRPFTDIGVYRVIKNSDNMTGIYQFNGAILVTSKPKWSQAIKLAKLLAEAYKEGYQDGKEDYDSYLGN